MKSSIPSPGELGLPEQFEVWRPAQVEFLEWCQRSRMAKKRTRAISAPTGFGKSAAVVADAVMGGIPTAIITDSRALQDQYLDSFGEMGMVDLRGRRNYQCEMREDYTCQEGYSAQCPYKGGLACPASNAEMRAATSSLVVTNYDKWTSTKKFGTGLSHIQRVVFDEGHEGPNALGRALRVFIGHRERDADIGMDAPANPDQIEAWKAFAIDARAIVGADLKLAEEALRAQSDRPSLVRKVVHLRNLYRRLGILAMCRPSNWVVEEQDKGFVFDAINPGKYAEAYLLLRVPDVLVVSATLRPKTLYMMGQSKESFDFREFDSEFPPERNPIYHVPTMRVDSRAASLDMLWLKLDQIISRRRDRKGIVHTISFARRDEIVNGSRWASSMLINERGEAPTEMIESFKAADDGAILVSPSVGQGHDFPGSACEWQFITKIPFPPPSTILKARTAEDKEYPYYLAMQKFVQICGRGMRYKADACENFIGDDHVDWFIPRYGHLAPKSFHAFFRRVSVLPQPPDRLPR